MRLTKKIAALWRNLAERERVERDLDEELLAAREMLVEEKIRAGLPPEAARRAAAIEMGGVQQLKERVRDARAGALLQSVLQDLGYAFRGLRRNPGFALAAVVALALGLGAINTVFTIANATVIRPLPFKDPNRVVYLATRDRTRARGVSYLDYQDWRTGTSAFVDLAAFVRMSMSLGDPDRAPEQLSGLFVSAHAFRLLGVAPMLGRDLTEEDDRPGAPAVVLLGHAVWTNRYGGDPAVVGRTVSVNGAPSTVIGVMPRGFSFDWLAELWQPLSRAPALTGQAREARGLSVFGRLADGVSIQRARVELAAAAARLASAYPATNSDIVPTIVPFNEQYLGTITDPIMVLLLGAAALVLLIACANVANLLLARAAHRSREISIRASLGASRGRIVRQLLVESALVAAIAGALGFAFSVAGVRLFAAVVQENMPYWVRFAMDGRVFAFLAVACAASHITFGLAPALHLARANVHDVLKESGRAGGGRARRWTGVLVTAQLALTVVLLTGAGLMVRSYLALYHADIIVDTSQLTTMSVRLSAAKYAAPQQRIEFHQRLEARLRANGAIPAAAVSSALPFTPVGVSRRGVMVDGPSRPADRVRLTATVMIGPRYFDAMGLRLTRGRAFSDADGAPGREAIIVNETFVSRYYPGEDVLGRTMWLEGEVRGAPATTATIVGVSPTIRQNVLNPEPVVYLPYRAAPVPSVWLIVRGARPDALAPIVREEVRALDPDIALGVMTMDRLLGRARVTSTVFGTVFTVFAAIALVLSTVGVYAVTAYAVSQRTQEIGIRMALGARRGQVIALFLRRASVQLAIGLVLGAAGAAAMTRLLRNFLVEAVSADPGTFVTVGILIVTLAVAACLLPARRATRMDPVAALRYE